MLTYSYSSKTESDFKDHMSWSPHFIDLILKHAKVLVCEYFFATLVRK